MKYKIKVFFTLLFALLFISIITFTSFAHSGRTDSQGGHHDYQNKSGLGSYHYHHGMGPHLHPNGVCPYGWRGSTQSSSSSSQQKDYIKLEDYPKTLNVNESANITFTMYSYYDDFSYTITSSDSSILKVNSDDTITAVGAGTANIIIKTSHTQETISVTVQEVEVKNINSYVSKRELQIGDSVQIDTFFYPENATNKNLKYSSSNGRVATVSIDGTVKGISAGTVTISITTSNNIANTIDINVFEVFPSSIECEDNVNLIVGDTYDFEINIFPLNANNTKFYVSCPDEDILKYSDSKLNAVKEGNTTLHIETWNGITKDIPIKIDIIPVEEISIIDSTKYIYSNIIDKSAEIVFAPRIIPEDATYKSVKWESSDNNIISVDQNDFTIKGLGKVTLSCVAHGGITNNIEIIVINKTLVIITVLFVVIGIVSVTIIIILHKKKVSA